MSVRPLPHFRHSPIGKSTHKRGFAYDHVNYITREDACTKTLAGNMPDSREDGARAYFDRAVYKDGVPDNARVADTFIIALPIEMTAEQRHEAITGFMDRIGHGRIAWLAAFHDKGEDAHNPHCHLILRDADVETGRKVIGTTTSAKDVREAEERGWKVPPRMTTKDLREAWCDHLNGEMERHGHEARFDQRTLKDQGLDREPQIHIGPQAQAMAEKGKSFESQDRKRGDHANVYTLLDAGSRAEHNQRIIDGNKEKSDGDRARVDGAWRGMIDRLEPKTDEQKEKLALRTRQAQERRTLYKEQKQDRTALRDAHDAEKLEHQRWGRKLYAQARDRAFQETKKQFAEQWKAVWKTKGKDARAAATAEIKKLQKAAYGIAAKAETDKVRPAKDAEWKSLKQSQDKERAALKQRHTEEVAALSRQHIAERCASDERWRHQHLSTGAVKTSARLHAHPGMASSQAAATKLIRTRARNPNWAGVTVEDRTHLQFFTERARAEQAQRATIRYQLNGGRQSNQIRAGGLPKKRTAPGQLAEQRTRNRAEINAQQAARKHRADAQEKARQSFAAGRALTAEERASAGGDVRDAAISQERRARLRREVEFRHFVQQQNSGKGRGGGRSGR